MAKDIHIQLEDYENILINVEYLINRCYVCFRCNLSRKVDHLKSPYSNHPPSPIYTTTSKTIKVSMTEKFHREKISFIGRIFIQSPNEAKKEVKNKWKK
jgi:hypothetical protein